MLITKKHYNERGEHLIQLLTTDLFILKVRFIKLTFVNAVTQELLDITLQMKKSQKKRVR